MKIVKIVPNKPKDGFCLSQGTAVFCGEEKIESVASITVHYEVDKPVRASIDLLGAWQDEVTAMGEFFMPCPRTGGRKKISKIEFADGSEFDCNGTDITVLSSPLKTYR